MTSIHKENREKNKETESHDEVKNRVFFKDSNIIVKHSILGDCFGLKKHVYR